MFFRLFYKVRTTYVLWSPYYGTIFFLFFYGSLLLTSINLIFVPSYTTHITISLKIISYSNQLLCKLSFSMFYYFNLEKSSCSSGVSTENLPVLSTSFRHSVLPFFWLLSSRTVLQNLAHKIVQKRWALSRTAKILPEDICQTQRIPSDWQRTPWQLLAQRYALRDFFNSPSSDGLLSTCESRLFLSSTPSLPHFICFERSFYCLRKAVD